MQFSGYRRSNVAIHSAGALAFGRRAAATVWR
jgi:hypothetical protein